MEDDRLRMLREMTRYPCADISSMAEETIREEYGADALGKQKKLRSTWSRNIVITPQIIVPEACVPKNWNLQKKDLDHLAYSTLQYIFYGTRNIRIPGQVLDLQKPHEMIAIELATGYLKRNDCHLSNEAIPKGSFGDLVTFMNRIAYDTFPDFAKQSHQFTKRDFLIKSESERLDSLPGEVKEKFCASFWKRYNAPKWKEPNNPNSFPYDPQTMTSYKDEIWYHFTDRFKREHLKK